MRGVILIFLTVAALAGAGFSTCTALHCDPHTRELIAAGAVCFLASILAFVPLWLTRGATQATVIQAALAGTVVHMIAVLVLGGAVVMLGLVPAKPFLICVLMQYWA